MMGHSHAVSGALLWVAVAPVAGVATHTDMGLPQVIAGAGVAAGAGLLPDLDHPSSTVARTFGPLTQGIAKLTSLLTGGHRNGTHTLLFVLGSGAATWAAVQFGPRWLTLVIMWLLIGLGMRGLHLSARGSGLGTFLVNGAIAAGLVYAIETFMPQAYTWMWFAVALGVAAHLIGDSLTPEGVPWLKPFIGTRFAIPVIPHTSSFLEVGVLTPVMVIAIGVLLWTGYAAQVGSQLSALPFIG